MKIPPAVPDGGAEGGEVGDARGRAGGPLPRQSGHAIAGGIVFSRPSRMGGRMQVHARISKEWRRRMIFMFAMIFGSGLWFLSDGYWMWPAETKRHEVFAEMAEKLVAEGRARDEEDPTVTRAWEKLAEERDWPTKVPKHRSEGDLAFQRWAGWILFGAGAGFAGWVAWNHTRSVRAEGDLITGASGEQVHLDSIVEMDRRKWANKGIAYAIYEVNGKRRRLTLDDHKFLGCEAIILEAEKRIAARAGTPGAAGGDK